MKIIEKLWTIIKGSFGILYKTHLKVQTLYIDGNSRQKHVLMTRKGGWLFGQIRSTVDVRSNQHKTAAQKDQSKDVLSGRGLPRPRSVRKYIKHTAEKQGINVWDASQKRFQSRKLPRSVRAKLRNWFRTLIMHEADNTNDATVSKKWFQASITPDCHVFYCPRIEKSILLGWFYPTDHQIRYTGCLNKKQKRKSQRANVTKKPARLLPILQVLWSMVEGSTWRTP